MEKISAVYKIVNTVTGDFYVGSSKNVLNRWANHKCPSMWKKYPNNQMYKDFQAYGIDKFRFQILAPVMEEHLKQLEQEFIEMLKPTYNNYRAKGRDVERYKEYNHSEKRKEAQRRYEQSDKCKETRRKYRQTDKCKETKRKYRQSDKGREAIHKYFSRMCFYNGKTLTLDALIGRFKRAGIPHAYMEAKKYLLES